ncbi:MAG: hypothetical protein TU35_002125 [Thermoproteus sp. AZ2]|jgi:hypothetical protein|uniref:Uncharacterized protein n=1 Tax=Thermoproteus sp. AZ2 TaxID=1609232 RepID=A0ACC6UZB6_9CREN|nr:MAG: hypothetical protein TU35_09045 [Thermoproteus sp. AZ2]
MRVSIILAAAGAVLIALAIVLFLFTASSSDILTLATDIVNKLNASQPVALKPGANITLTSPEAAVLVINSTRPLPIMPANATAYSGGLEVALVTPNISTYIVNNYTETVVIRYALVSLPAAKIASSLSYALAAFALGVLGSALLIIAAALYALKR